MKLYSWTRPSLLLPVLFAGVSCHSFDCDGDSSNQVDSFLRRVPVASDHVPPGAWKDLAPGDRVRKQSYSIDEDGTFTYYRSVETEVASFGAEFSNLHREAAEEAGVEPFGGVLLRHVHSRSPAAGAGLHDNDVILSIEGKTGLNADRLDFLIEQSKPGQKVSLAVQRGHDALNVVVELGSEKRIESGKLFQQKLEVLNDMDRTGLRLVELTDEVRPIVLGPNTARKGVMVMEVLPGGSAFSGGIRPRDVITDADEQPILTLGDYARAVSTRDPGSQVAFNVLRAGASLRADVEVTVGAKSESGFDLPVVVSYNSKPSHTRFDLLLGFLFNYESCRTVRNHDGQPEDFRSRNWGMIIDLVRYTNNSRGKGRIVFLWVIPIWWGG